VTNEQAGSTVWKDREQRERETDTDRVTEGGERERE